MCRNLFKLSTRTSSDCSTIEILESQELHDKTHRQQGFEVMIIHYRRPSVAEYASLVEQPCDRNGQWKWSGQREFRTSKPPPRQHGQVNTKVPTSRQRGFGCSRIYGRVIIDGRTGQVRVPVCGQEGGHRFHSWVISNRLETPHIVLLLQPEHFFCNNGAIILVLLSTNQRRQSDLTLRAFQGVV